MREEIENALRQLDSILEITTEMYLSATDITIYLTQLRPTAIIPQ